MPVERVARLVEAHVVGQRHRQVVFGHRDDAAGFAVDDRDRAPPVALARDAPVAQPVGDRAFARARGLHAPGDVLLGLGDGEAVEEVRVDRDPVAEIGLVADREVVRRFGRRDDRDHRQAVFAGEVEVALVVAGTAEDRARAVLHEHEVGDEDGQLLALDEGVQRDERRQVALLLGPLDRRLAGAEGVAFGDERGEAGVIGGELVGERVVGRDGAERGTEDGVVPRGEHVEPVVAPGERERHAQTLGAADPVRLHQPHPFGPAVEAVERVEEVVGVGGDAQHPLRQLAPLDQRARAPAAAVDHLLVGEHGIVDRVPVDPGFLAIREPAREEVEEHLLFVPEVRGVAGGELARPVVAQPHRLELAPHGGDVLLGPFGGMDPVLDRRVLGRHAEGVPAHRVEHVEAARPLVARHHVAERIVAHVPHVDAP